MNKEIEFKQLETKAALEVMESFRNEIRSSEKSAETWSENILEEQKKERPNQKKIDQWVINKTFHLMIKAKMEKSLEFTRWDIESQLFDF